MRNFTIRTQCPVCAAFDFDVIYRTPYDTDPVRALILCQYEEQGIVDLVDFVGEEYAVAHCHQCDLLFQQTVPTETMMERIYNEMISPSALERFEQSLLTLEGADRIAGELAVLFRMVGKPLPQIRVLDYGFGHGRWARMARGMGATVFVTEIGEDKRRVARALGLEFLEDAEIDEMRFDIVHTEQVLEHLLEPGREFARLARVAQVLFKAAVPPRKNVDKLLVRQGLPMRSRFAQMIHGEPYDNCSLAFDSLQPLEHLNAYSSRTMRWLGDRNGFDLASQVRQGKVGIDLSSAASFAKSAANVAQMAGKMLLKPDKGYYLFRRRL